MSRHLFKASLAVLLVGGWATAINHAAAPDPAPLPPVASLIYPKGSAEGMLWPHEGSLLWSINRLDPSVKATFLTLEIRTLHKPEGTPVSGAFVTRAESEKTRKLTMGDPARGVTLTSPLLVGIQAIDLERVGLATPEQSIRLLSTMRVNGGHGSNGFGIEGRISGSYSAGSAAKWEKGEMHLHNLFVEEKDKQIAIYCSVLVQYEKR
jgi:hypothetical protein